MSTSLSFRFSGLEELDPVFFGFRWRIGSNDENLIMGKNSPKTPGDSSNKASALLPVSPDHALLRNLHPEIDFDLESLILNGHDGTRTPARITGKGNVDGYSVASFEFSFAQVASLREERRSVAELAPRSIAEYSARLGAPSFEPSQASGSA